MVWNLQYLLTIMTPVCWKEEVIPPMSFRGLWPFLLGYMYLVKVFRQGHIFINRMFFLIYYTYLLSWPWSVEWKRYLCHGLCKDLALFRHFWDFTLKLTIVVYHHHPECNSNWLQFIAKHWEKSRTISYWHPSSFSCC